MSPFDAYIDQIMASVSVNSQEKLDLKEELLTHLTMLEKEYLIKGCGEAEAVTLAMKRFGEANQLQKDYKNIRSSFQIIKDISLICFIIYFPMIFLLTLSQSIRSFVWYIDTGYGSYSIKECFSRLIENLFSLPSFGGVRSPCNLVPFKTFLEIFRGILYGGFDGASLWIISVYLKKIILFIPLGLFLPVLFDRGKNLSGNILVSLIIGCIIEMLQYILVRGVCDIDDVLFYVLGTVIGFIIYKIIRIFVKYETT